MVIINSLINGGASLAVPDLDYDYQADGTIIVHALDKQKYAKFLSWCTHISVTYQHEQSESPTSYIVPYTGDETNCGNVDKNQLSRLLLGYVGGTVSPLSSQQ